MEGVDYSGSRPSGICLWANGKRFAARYFGPGGAWKHASAAEVAGLRAAGIDIVALAEGFEDDARLGYAKGQEHAISASSAAMAAGKPQNRPIFFAVDYDAPPSHYTAIAQYCNGAASVIGRGNVGIYAGYKVVDYLFGIRAATFFFQTYAWSGGRWHPAAGLQQYRNRQVVCGGEVDLCRSVADDFGQWSPPAYEVAPPWVPSYESDSAIPWEFGDALGSLANQVGTVGDALSGASSSIEGLM